MILVAVVAEFLEEYTEVVSRVVEHMVNQHRFPRRLRLLILSNLPFAAPSRIPPPHLVLPPTTPFVGVGL
ncbi:hypothetical protein DCAR_0625768 [Daucus carota subsp. sativus]|uniref:Uncharacterized protein n=1 Tax=Daucus carota subsp. sativus TaxID=79200 RepID=A0AAF0XFU3_DAUCS|nr:PREDICTED: uncharacterized protein LOC108224554 [Daucus carota subsp. sativus]WOH06342.1 hypothetical protein DCAR_0625768 [Daucus carota subsp. sativus]